MRCDPTRWQWPRQLLGLVLSLPLAALAGPEVVASIQPLHSLVASIMQGVAEPVLLVRGGASPHDYALRPSDARALADARVVFWIGPELETFMVKPLQNAQGKVRSVALLDAPGVTVLPLRSGGAWEARQPEHDHEHGASTGRDAHIWLDPGNAAAMARRVVAVLGEVDPEHRADYERNGSLLADRLDQLNRRLTAELEPIKRQPFIVFHDAYRYFEQRYNLNTVGAITLGPEQRPGAKRVAEIQARIRSAGVRCVFSEPQFQPALVETLIAGSSARTGVLDPLGAAIPSGPEAYFQLVRALADALRACLNKV
ncbi:MAG: zinc ABC transporter substrate-binding protein [Candidatus Competibacteraceae bacterium]|nr:zinc ABC transporter substrate-binding protein [Candidatus Competibacteraceae bacterium]MBK7983613.1 zinc ABC transporter substrate-binding protein [Candidatus Competibacteraceae bacterium]MBK8897847.1 zinc ABC transporter substrate-binding protein [Candidatus Competibacteraceae bacterium]MBK8961650.1 zinc ABC transporter substrate-binding protein [Candidatus Competibacteraceae bacterium]MBK9950872.1 zinc ABC transporter substrate-binding protein [Candidatus Competibacteraceae bacterium]